MAKLAGMGRRSQWPELWDTRYLNIFFHYFIKALGSWLRVPMLGRGRRAFHSYRSCRLCLDPSLPVSVQISVRRAGFEWIQDSFLALGSAEHSFSVSLKNFNKERTWPMEQTSPISKSCPTADQLCNLLNQPELHFPHLQISKVDTSLCGSENQMTDIIWKSGLQ